MPLAETGFAVGDIVTYASDQESTGGVIFQIVENCDPVKPAGAILRGRYSSVPVDEKGKKIPAMCINGYIRLKPLFSFFPTQRGQKPVGKGSTILLYHLYIKGNVKKVDLLTIASKYAELGNLIRDLAITGGMEAP